MALRRLRPVSAPRPPRMHDNRQSALQDSAVSDDDDALFAYWLAQTAEARADPTRRRLWQLLTSPIFADLWYEARAAGERFRASIVTSLYARQSQPGGLYPDPRLPASFSERALVHEAARSLALSVWQQPQCLHHEPNEPVVMLMTYAREDRMPPKLIVHAEMPEVGISQGRILFDMACMLGFITREQGRMLDPDAPHGATRLPSSPNALSIMHQFAFAFLYLEPRCPPEWACHCNLIRERYSAAPQSHAQSTDSLSLADLADATRRWRDEQSGER